MENTENFFIATKDKKGEFTIFSSLPYCLTEIDLLSLIKICMVEARNKTAGKKILNVYRDSTEKRKDLTEQRLNAIGVKKHEKEFTTRKNPKIR